MADFFSGGKFSNLTFWAVFYQNLTIFRPISTKRYHKCSSFPPLKHIFWSSTKCRSFFGGKVSNLTFWEFLTKNSSKYPILQCFDLKNTGNLLTLLVFTWNILSWVFLLRFYLFWCPLWLNMALFNYPCCVKMAQNQHSVYFFT